MFRILVEQKVPLTVLLYFLAATCVMRDDGIHRGSGNLKLV